MLKPLINIIQDEKKFALVVTLVLHLFIFGGMVFVKSLASDKNVEIVSPLISLEFIEEEIPIEEEEIIPDEDNKMDKEDFTNQAQDLEDQEDDLSEDEIKRLLEEELKQMSAAAPEQNTQEDLSITETGTETIRSKTKGTGSSKAGKTQNPTKEDKNNNSFYGSSRSSFVTYRVMYRKCTVDPIPVYLCEKNGKIVLNIWVNKNGKVTKALVNTTLSAPYDKCLYETAVEYALKTRFTKYEFGGREQGGSIIYEFQGQ